MENRALLAIALSVAVLVLYSLFFPQTQPVTPEKPQTVAAQNTAGSMPSAMATAPVGGIPAAAGSTTAAMPDKDVVVETGLYKAVISTRGGVIKSWKLKKITGEDGKAMEMVRFPGGVLPLAVVPDGMTWQDAQSFNFTSSVDAVSLPNDGAEGVLTLTHAAPDGTSITKRLTFNDVNYAVGTEVSVGGYNSYTMYMGESFGSLTDKANKGYGHVGFLTLVDGSSHKDEAEELEGPLSYSGKTGWVAVTDKYFVGAVVAPDGITAVFEKGTSDWGYVGVKSQAPSAKYLVYAGPKDYDILKSLDHGLDQAVDFGWFTFIAKPLFVALKFFHGLVGNYGWAIIIITFIIKLAFAPLTHKQQKSMKRMQKLQPAINELKEKFKGDPQRMNTEMMDLYKKEKVNPLGGCLPMVVQIPVFVALYNVLGNSIELRHAPFALWLVDLSAKDPYYILPVLMGVSMFVMQKMTPTTMEPMQAKIMMFLPIAMMFMFISLPSGLVLYFTVSNLLSMAQQFYINKSATD